MSRLSVHRWKDNIDLPINHLLTGVVSACYLQVRFKVTRGHNMRPALYDTEELARFLTINVVATMTEIKNVLGTEVYKTALRKLKQLNYLASYSHSGRYYTLERIAKFDHRGLWSYGGVHFSKRGTLMSTLKHFVSEAKDGYFVDELELMLSVGVKMSLSRLLADGAVSREKVANRYLYCSADPAIRKQQILTRNLMESAEQELSDEARAAVVIFLSMLDEKERRLYAGVEAIKYGFGGDQWIAKLLGMHRKTVARGRRELLSGEVEVDRARIVGGGRKPVEKKAGHHRKNRIVDGKRNSR
jgi:hypothetical protein